MDKQTTTVDLGQAQGLDSGCGGCGGCAGGGRGGGCGGGCGCGGTCGSATLERPLWFAGQLVGPEDLEALQRWVMGRARRHNRMIHGWGVSCGLEVQQLLATDGSPVPWSLRVRAGFALSGCGDDISVPADVRVDVREPQPSGSDACAPPVDPWCAPVRERRDPERTYYLAVRYAEVRGRPVRASACSCGCDDEPCEYSRVAESYQLAVLDALPDCYEDAPVRGLSTGAAARDSRSGIQCTPAIRERGSRPCADCCSPWVVLADLRVTPAGVIEVDMLAHRRFVAQLGELAFTCAPQSRELKVSFSQVERDALSAVFAESAGEDVTSGVRDGVLTAPAVALRGAKASNALKAVLGDRSVAELAGADSVALREEAAASGADPDAVANVIELARVAVRLAQP